MTMPRQGLPPVSLAWTIWGCGAALYFIGFYQRVAPAVITTELTQTFGLTAAALGNLSGFYFYSYVAAQLPTGMLADRFGPRILLTSGGIIAALGTAVFAVATEVVWADVGRFLIGGSVGVAFVSMLKIASHWMPARQFAMASGVALAIGVFGAVFAGAPLRLMVDDFGWRNVMWATAAFTLLVAAMTWFMVRDDPTDRGYKSYFFGAADHTQPKVFAGVFDGLREVLRYRTVVLMFIIPGAPSSIVLTFAGLWGVPFLTTHYGLSLTNAAGLCSTMLVAWGVGSLAFGAVSDRVGRRKSIYIGGLTVSLLLWAVLIFTPRLPYFWLVVLIAATGFFASCFIISFAFAKESVPARLAGTVSGVANMGVIQGPMYMQPLVGVILDRHWQGTMRDGNRVFDIASYQQGFSMMLIWGVIALVLLCFTRETYCRQTE